MAATIFELFDEEERELILKAMEAYKGICKRSAKLARGAERATNFDKVWEWEYKLEKLEQITTTWRTEII